MHTPVSNALNRLKTRLQELRRDESGATTFTEVMVAVALTACIALMSFGIILPANQDMNDMVHDKNAAKPTVVLAESLRLQAEDMVNSIPDHNRIGAVLNTADFDAALRKDNVIPSTFYYYICKTQHSRVSIAAFDTAHPEDGYTAADPYNNDGTKIKGQTCLKWQDLRSVNVNGTPSSAHGDFDWTPLKEAN